MVIDGVALDSRPFRDCADRCLRRTDGGVQLECRVGDPPSHLVELLLSAAHAVRARAASVRLLTHV